jgi:LysM repeat protein
MDMKKIITCAALLAGIVFLSGRLNAQVESDIVGYTTVEVTKEWTLMGVNFTGLDNPSTEEIPILSLISGNFSAGDQIQIPKINGADVTEWNPAVGKWCTISRGKVTEKEATYTIAAGQGFWLKSTTASLTSPLNVQISGKVYDGDPLTVALGQQYTIFSPISPTEIEVNSEELVWESLSHGDQVQIPTANGAEIAGWNSNLNKWCTISRNKVTTTPSTIKIKAGASVWVVSTNADATVEIASPLSK